MSAVSEIESAHAEVVGDIELARIAVQEAIDPVGDKGLAIMALHSAHAILGGCREKLDAAIERALNDAATRRGA